MTTEENKRVIQRFIDEALNRKNLDSLETLVAEDFVEQVPFPGQGPGREGLRDTLRAFIVAFPDMHWAIEEQIAEGENVVTRFTMSGTHQGAFLGMLPTGKAVKVWGIVMDVVREGRMAESRILMDTIGLMQQLSESPSAAE
ncbi:MAG: hypothetical protein JWL77_3185 [Chthonomonadaceae bacterium]|nr:hypothetical protein [Chthonomonadaceae bacterium]